MFIYALRTCTSSHLSHVSSSGHLTPLPLTSCRQPQAIHIQYINSVFNIFPNPSNTHTGFVNHSADNSSPKIFQATNADSFHISNILLEKLGFNDFEKNSILIFQKSVTHPDKNPQ